MPHIRFNEQIGSDQLYLSPPQSILLMWIFCMSKAKCSLSISHVSMQVHIVLNIDRHFNIHLNNKVNIFSSTTSGSIRSAYHIVLKMVKCCNKKILFHESVTAHSYLKQINISKKNPSTLSVFNLNKFQKTTHFFLHFFGDFNAHCTKKKNYYILCCSEKANDDSETNRACIIIDDDMLASQTYYHLVDWHNLLIQAGNLQCSSLCNPVLVYIWQKG